MPRYDFANISPVDFEDLARDLLQAETGELLESFGPGRDLGIDFRFGGRSGETVVQAKHYASSPFSALLSVAKKESSKIQALAPVRYIFVTSVSLSPARKAKIQHALEPTKVALPDIIGREDMNNLLGRHPEIEKRHFKLWLSSTSVLERILQSGVFNRTAAELEHIRSIIPTFVSNKSVGDAERILDQAHALIVAGAPGVGKTTLARMILWNHAQDGWQVSVVDNIAEAFSIASEGPKRIVFFDDFLGQVQLTPDGLRAIDQALPAFLHKVRTSKRLRFVMTTRDYIWHQAQSLSDKMAAPSLRVSEFVLDVGAYTRSVRAKILYNHLYFSQLQRAELLQFLEDDFFLKVIAHPNYSPRVVGLVTSADYVALLNMPLQRAIVAVLENPGLLWDIPYRSHISAEGRALLISLFCNEAWLTPVDDLFETFMRFTAVLGSAPVAGDALARFRYSLRELEGSFVSIQHRRVRFANPGVKDFLSHVITTDRLVPVLLPAVKTGPEVRQLWEYWNSNSQSHSASRTGSELADAWTSACVRALESSSGKSALRLLPTLMGVCEKFDSDECRDVVRDCIDRIRVDYSDDNQIRELNDIFDLLEMATLDSEFAQELGRLLAGSSESILETHASGMDFSPTAELIDHIARYAEDDEHIGNLPADTLHRVLEEIDGTLETLDSVAELDAFAGQLQAALKKHGVARSLPAARIESRREELFTTPENPRPTTLEALVGQERLTDDEIRSQFESLRWRVQ